MKRHSLKEDRPRWGAVDRVRGVVYPKHTSPWEWYGDGHDIFAISADLESFDVM